MDFNRLKTEIKKVLPTEPIFIYIGVGTFAGLLNEDGTLAPENYHQFPPFVQDLYNRITKLNLFLVLIDPLQENPPYLTRDFPVVEVQPNHYMSNDSHLHVLVYRNSVYTEPDDKQRYNEQDVNITSALQELNRFAIDNRASLLYHDFTGRRTADLAEYFDYDYEPVMDQIVYAMSAREYHGCYFDLTKPDAYFATKVVNDDLSPHNERHRPIIKMFNYFKYILKERYYQAEEEKKTYPVATHSLIEEQKQHIINNIKTEFKNNFIAALRQVKKILLNPNDDIDPNTYLYNSAFNKAHRNILVELLKNKGYELMNEILFNICATKLDIISRLKQLDVSGEEMLRCITADPDPYQWYKIINQFI